MTPAELEELRVLLILSKMKQNAAKLVKEVSGGRRRQITVGRSNGNTGANDVGVAGGLRITVKHQSLEDFRAAQFQLRAQGGNERNQGVLGHLGIIS